MNNSFKSKLLILSLSLILFITFLNIHQANAYDPTIGWTSQATGCNAVSGNIDGTIDNVYLGIGSTVPQSVLNQYPNANAGFLELWKTNMVGLSVNKLKSFIIPADQGYTTPGAQLYGKDLFFQTTILLIYNGDGTGVTTRNSVVKVLYSLYTDCQVASSSPQYGSDVPTTSTSAAVVTTKASPPNYTGYIVAGGLIGVVILSAAGYVVMNGRKPNLSTDKIIDQTRIKETQNIQSLKETLVTKQQDTISRSSAKKQSLSRRRR